MAVNKIIYNGETLVDLTNDTVTADDLAAGVKATGADGRPVVGLLPKVTIDTELSLSSTNPVQNKTITAALSNLDIDIATNDEIDNALNLAGSGDLPTGGGGIVPIAMGGTGATTTAGARANLGVSATTDFAAVAFSGAYNDLAGTPTIPTATGDLTNNSSYITSSALGGYVKSVNGVTPDSSGEVTISVSGGSSGGNYTLPTASSSTLGGVKIGSGLTINTSGVLSADVTSSTLTAYAKTTELSAVAKSGSYNDLTNKPTIPSTYTLPAASSSVMGGVKIGNNISVAGGTISLNKNNVTSALGYTPATTNNASFTGTTMVQTLTVSSALNIPGGQIWIE